MSRPLVLGLRSARWLALILIALACATPAPPRVSPRVVRVATVSPDGIALDVQLGVHNPNSFSIAANAVSGNPTQWFDPTAFVLQPAGTFGTVGRNELLGPDLRTVDLSLSRSVPVSSFGSRSRLEFRLEIFNLFNRANFGPPSLIAFAGTTDGEAPLPSFGQIRTTVTSARQTQLGIRFTF
jgi:hypothetical protein